MRETNCGFNSSHGINGADLLATWGPTLQVNIGFDKEWNAENTSSAPHAGINFVDALVDTGAGESCIDDLLASQLNLPIIDKRFIAGSAGQHEAKIYLAQIHVHSLSYTIYGAFAGVHLADGGQLHKALIGRTFLKNFTMLYEGHTGRVVLKFAL
jgi:predicted aspartyl protease